MIFNDGNGNIHQVPNFQIEDVDDNESSAVQDNRRPLTAYQTLDGSSPINN